MRKMQIMIVTFVLLFSLAPKTEASSHIFTDVPKNHPNYSAIMYLLDQGVLTPQKRFGLDDKVTREEVAIMVAKATGLDGRKTKTKFKDVPAGRFSSGYINSAAKAKIINGYPDGTFKPTQNVTRGHMAAFIANAFHLKEEKNITFKDVPKGSTSYHAVRKLAHANITSGYPDGTFKPNQTLTRSHIAAFIARAMDPSFRPVPPVPVTRGINFSMNLSQVKKIEASSPAVFMGQFHEGNLVALVYRVTKYGYNAELIYIFENNKLSAIAYDFLADDTYYHSSDEIETIYVILNDNAKNELGTPLYEGQEGYTEFISVWEKKGYHALLQVHDKEVYTSGELIFMPY
ncbi:hypothetical protein SporoP37_01415 [Sporosarcina sp. P37]|uniref:S-layer homology domain-containing protein n=1 Tax=unclassified Sporosarcina TaxID=2647733 RepID=UPI000A17E19A|nr:MULTISPECIES: S-layer homology domain-containing protein [unclassified Sporosarcina]ARK23483.1 hypothetical protein SporoP37_01415 [Sporosarcina sp. P37]PID18694.1 S-layer homology domain-containing protein [Sporosarcina sp. P35]